MRYGSILALLIIAGILSVVAGFWSGSGAGLGPIRTDTGEPMSQASRNVIMAFTFIGGIGAFLVAVLTRRAGRKMLGVVTLISAAFMIPSLFQANVLSIFSLFILLFVGLTFLLRQPVEGQR